MPRWVAREGRTVLPFLTLYAGGTLQEKAGAISGAFGSASVVPVVKPTSRADPGAFHTMKCLFIIRVVRSELQWGLAA